MEDFAQKLKELRLEKGLKQKEVSEALGLSKNAFTNYELGIREPSLDTLKKICKFFNVSSDYLLDL
ncbi:MAG: helix-turn-helix transcriptional regulator [Clostridiales bacterium]|nr:helix-turn-helix transcriptional regulator [Clostridiales bacterium]